MPCIQIGPGSFLTFGGHYQPGDPPPSGYLDWHEWADVQHKAGLRQARCCDCGKLKFPQELSHIIRKSIAYRTKRDAQLGANPITMESRVCLECANARSTA